MFKIVRFKKNVKKKIYTSGGKSPDRKTRTKSVDKYVKAARRVPISV